MTENDLRPHCPGRRRRVALRRIGQVLYFAVSGSFLAIGLTLGIGAAVAPGHTTYSGTFVEDRCAASRWGCTYYGTWTSDSGSIVRPNIQLDGSVGADGTARASYTPTGFNNDAQNNIVHTAFAAQLRSWTPWLYSVIAAFMIAVRILGAPLLRQARAARAARAR